MLLRLFEAPEFQADPHRLAVAVFGASTTPTGPWSFAAALYAGDKSSLQGIKELRAIVAKLFPKGNHLLSSDLFVREAGRWVRLA